MLDWRVPVTTLVIGFVMRRKRLFALLPGLFLFFVLLGIFDHVVVQIELDLLFFFVAHRYASLSLRSAATSSKLRPSSSRAVSPASFAMR